MWTRKTPYLIVVILIGLTMIILPDSNKRLISFSKNHGLSIQDAIGLILIVFPYTILIIKAWNNRARLTNYHDTLILSPLRKGGL